MMNNSISLLLQEVNAELPTGENCFGSLNELEEQFGGGDDGPNRKPEGNGDQRTNED
jgi:hypothetical protein